MFTKKEIQEQIHNMEKAYDKYIIELDLIKVRQKDLKEKIEDLKHLMKFGYWRKK
jgi:hypothetical protein